MRLIKRKRETLRLSKNLKLGIFRFTATEYLSLFQSFRLACICRPFSCRDTRCDASSIARENNIGGDHKSHVCLQGIRYLGL